MLIDLEKVSFAEWLIELNVCAIKAGYKGEPIATITGQLEWYPYYEEGLTPSLALERASGEGQEFGIEY